MNRNFRALKHRAYLFVWIGSLLSNIGTWMENVGQGWVVASQTHSPFQVELLSFAQFIPIIFLAIPAGILADRYNRRKILMNAQIAMCFFAIVLAVVAHLGKATANLVILITFLEGTAYAFNGPAWQSVVPHLVPRKDLESAIALNSIQYNLARLIGPALAGIIVARFGFAYAFDVNAVSFLAVIAAIAFAKIELTAPKMAEDKERRPLSGAFLWVYQNRGARRIIISLTLFAIFGAPLQGLMPFFASDILKIGPSGLGILLACLGAGAVSGAFLLGKFPTYYPRHHLIPLSMFILGILEMIYSQSLNMYLSCFLLYVLGIFWLWCLISCNTAMQLLVPDHMRGRAMSILIVANLGMLPFGHLIGGGLATYVGPRKTLLITSFFMALVGFITLLRRVPEIDGMVKSRRKIPLRYFFSEVVLASSHRAEALSLDRSSEKIR